MNKEDKCLVPECTKTEYSRGLCANHYILVLKLIKKKEVSEEKLVKAGKMKPRLRVKTQKVLEFFLGK